MYIPQFPLNELLKKVSPNKVVVIFGPRRVGKTTLLKKFLSEEDNYLFVTGEDIFVQEYLASNSVEKLKNFIGNKDLLVVDEAQYIPNIGLNLKLIVDHIPGIRVIATGSSSFELAKEMGEPLTGRKFVIKMFPLSQIELNQIESTHETSAQLENRLIYGSYPEVVMINSLQEKKEYLHDLVSSYLLKDVLAFEGIQKSKKILDLLILLAFQVGNQVSHNELAKNLTISKSTVERYLDLLEQGFVITSLRAFSRNLRNEVTKMPKYYFYDNGIRNAIINNFNTLALRDDIGALFENYLVMERIKKQEYTKEQSRNFFWRTYDQKELDWVEERDGKLFGFEFKWKETCKAPDLWVKSYSNASFDCINKSNYLKFIT